jgi:ABC-2 type transport system permease protein
MNGRHLLAVGEREFRTVIRTRALLWLSAAFVVVIAGLVWVGDQTGYASTALGLLLPVEVLVPVLAAAFAYRSVLQDRQSGELAMLRTYPIDRTSYVTGVYLGRAVAFLAVVLGALGIAGGLAGLSSGPPDSFLATHAAGDSVFLYGRFVVLTALFALTNLAFVVAVSAIAGSVRAALALVVAVAVGLVLGLDLGVLAGVTGGFLGDDTLGTVLSATPHSAYRGLVFDLVVGPVSGAPASGASPFSALAALLAWLAGTLVVGWYGVWPRRSR